MQLTEPTSLKPLDGSSLKPLPVDTVNSQQGRDEAYKGGFNITHLEFLINDGNNQPYGWRTRCDVAAGYVDGKQFTAEQEEALIKEGLQGLRPTNLVNRVIRTLCGTEAKSRTDVKVEADDDESDEVCEALNPRMKEAQRETYADMAVSAAYFGQVGPGIGWVEVARNADPLAYNYRVNEVHRNEISWDWRAKDMVLASDARWIVRTRWSDLDMLQAAMPKYRELLANVANGWAGFSLDNDMLDENLVRAWNDESTFSNTRSRIEWYDSARKRVKVYEVWYKVPAMGVIIHWSPTRRMLFDQSNQAHIQAVASGRVKVTRELTDQVRMALYAGPHRLHDVGTSRRNFPYIPFFAYRDDQDKSPYGLVDGMIGPQDEYNARRLRINWLLRARQIVMDNDALDLKANTLANIADRVMRPDLTVILKADRTNKDANAFRVMNALQMDPEQMGVMQDAKQLIQDVPGVYGSQLGQAASGVTSGIANSLLIEQGAVAMGDLNDNYRNSRRMVFEELMDRIVEDHATADMQMTIGRGSNRRSVILNQWDGEAGMMRNNVKDAPVRVGLGEVPSTPAFRMQQQQQIATIIGAMQGNPQAVAILSPSFIESTDLPNRMELADDLRRTSGIPTAGDKRAQQDQQAQQQAEQAQQKAIADAAAKIQLEGLAANVYKTKSETELNNAKSFQIGHGAGLAQAQAGMPEPTAGAAAPDPQAQKDQVIEDALQEALMAMRGVAPAQQPG